ncbi:MAG: ATP synthase F0 subunit B [Thermodesulfobacteriota bacterium]
MRSVAKTTLAGAAIAGGLLLSGQSAWAEGGITVIPDSTTVWQIINFIVLIGILNLVLYRPIRRVVAQRRDKVDGLGSSIESFRRDAADKEKAWAEGMKKARTQGLGEKNTLIEAAVTEEKKIIEEIAQRSQKTLAETRDRVAADAARAAADLQREIDAFAAAIGAKILGREVA